jgi:hypothetical protein
MLFGVINNLKVIKKNKQIKIERIYLQRIITDQDKKGQAKGKIMYKNK